MSPHLQVWRWHVTMTTSILHRISGGALYVGGLILALWAIALAGGPETYAMFLGIMGAWYGKVALLDYGITGRLDTMQAAILIEKLKIFEDEIAARNEVAERYARGLSPGIRDDGRRKVLAGVTTLEEVERVTRED